MKTMLEQIRTLQAKQNDERVAQLLAILGDETSIADLEAAVSHYKRKLQGILANDLLEWMQENDQTTFETDDLKVKISTYISAGIKDAETAFEWMRSNDYADSIKDNLEFPKGELTGDIIQAIDDYGATYSMKSGVHPQTLKKLMRLRLEAGEAMPTEDDGFKINYFDTCEVKEK